ncbi:Glycosyl transferase domain containing protein [Aphelenchoides bicaudatus]|nr:Glycosyl transferase domain containing protein [Aphelenchoides bicaudatus]
MDEMLNIRSVRRYYKWPICAILFITAYFIFGGHSSSAEYKFLDPFIDANQLKGYANVDFKDFNSFYTMYSSRHLELCKGKSVLVLIASSPKNVKRRKENVPDDFVVQFFFGAQTDYDTELDLYVEKQEFDDILRYNVGDTYENLVFKTHAMLAWQRKFCPEVKYLIKIDDDTVADLKRLDYFIKNVFEKETDVEKPAIFCKTHTGVSPYRSPWSKWYVSRLAYSADTFPTYCSGGVYLMTMPTVNRLLSATREINLIQIEDVVFTGILPSLLNITVHSSDAFCTKQNEHDSRSFSIVYLILAWTQTDTDSHRTIIPPWMDANQVAKNVTLDFKDFHFSYPLFSSKAQNACDKKEVVVFVASAPGNFNTRKQIRETWANKTNIPSSFLVQFIIGAQFDPTVEIDLYAENQEHQDLIRFDAPDIYRNLFVKTHALFEWFKWQCPQGKYLIKMDDDAVMHLNRVEHFIRQDFDAISKKWPASMFCNVQEDHHPFRNPVSKLYVPFSSYLYFTYPNYCQGGAYMATRDSIIAILNATRSVKMLRLEDVLYTGIIGHQVGLQIASIFCVLLQARNKVRLK